MVGSRLGFSRIELLGSREERGKGGKVVEREISLCWLVVGCACKLHEKYVRSLIYAVESMFGEIPDIK